MSSSLRDRARILIVVVALASGACVRPGPPSLSVTTLNADLVFGVKPPAEPGPANTGAAGAAGTVATPATGGGEDTFEEEDEELPSQDFGPPTTRRPVPRPSFESTTATVSDCPPAAQNAFPEETAPLNVPADRYPREGEYRWKRTGTYETPNALDPSKPVVNNADGFETRVLQKLTKEGADPTAPARMRYSYEIVQPEAISGQIVTTRYRVDTAAVSREVENTLGPERVSGGEPERGLTIKNIGRTDGAGNRIGRGFAPTTGLLVGPLPIRTGEMFQSVAVDPVTNQSMRYEAQLVARDRVDACGEILDGWRVEGKLTSSGEGAQTFTYTLIVAPQLGMIPILERIQGPGVDLTYTIGQKIPTAPSGAGS